MSGWNDVDYERVDAWLSLEKNKHVKDAVDEGRLEVIDNKKCFKMDCSLGSRTCKECKYNYFVREGFVGCGFTSSALAEESRGIAEANRQRDRERHRIGNESAWGGGENSSSGSVRLHRYPSMGDARRALFPVTSGG